MNVIKRIKEVLDVSYPEIKYTVENEMQLSIKKENENGFDIRVIEGADDSVMFFNQWHWHFEHNSDDIDQLFLLFGYGLSKHGRLKAYVKGGKEYKWDFESLNSVDKKWHVFGTTGTVNLKFWMEQTVKLYQNEMIEIRDYTLT